jgi:hypothetical protein
MLMLCVIANILPYIWRFTPYREFTIQEGHFIFGAGHKYLCWNISEFVIPIALNQYFYSQILTIP